MLMRRPMVAFLSQPLLAIQSQFHAARGMRPTSPPAAISIPTRQIHDKPGLALAAISSRCSHSRSRCQFQRSGVRGLMMGHAWRTNSASESCAFNRRSKFKSMSRAESIAPHYSKIATHGREKRLVFMRLMYRTGSHMQRLSRLPRGLSPSI